MTQLAPALAMADFYKVGHPAQYPKGMQHLYSNFTPRSSKYLQASLGEGYDGKIVVFGLQGFLIDFLILHFNNTFFNLPKHEAVKRYKRRLDNSLGKDAVDVAHIEALHDLGFMPLIIRAIPEGSRIPANVPMCTIMSTITYFGWGSDISKPYSPANPGRHPR